MHFLAVVHKQLAAALRAGVNTWLISCYSTAMLHFFWQLQHGAKQKWHVRQPSITQKPCNYAIGFKLFIISNVVCVPTKQRLHSHVQRLPVPSKESSSKF